MHDYVVESVLHAAVTVAVIEAVLVLWRLSAPSVRLAARLGELAVPTLLTPLLVVGFPGRRDLAFRLDRAWFDSSQWHAVTLAGLGVDDWAVVAASMAGLILFGRDLLALVAAAPSAERAPAREADAARVARVAAGRGGAGAPVLVTGDEVPLLFVSGSRHPRIVVSMGALERLDDDELGVALAHERAHVDSGDVRLGWWLGAARLLQAFNPFVHVMARAAIVEMERRADHAACRDARDTRMLTRARAKLVLADRVDRADFGPAVPTGSGPKPSVERHEVNEPGVRAASAALAVAIMTVSVLVFFVV